MLQNPETSQEKPAILALCIGALFLVALFLRLHGIDAKPFWMDEVTTIHRAGLKLPDMVKDSLFFHQLPAFFVVTSWSLNFGSNEFWVRLPAALFGALSCVLCFGIARSIAGLKAGLAAGMLMAASPAMLQYAQEARSYTMVISAILVGLWGLVLLALNRKEKPAAWAAYIIGTAAALNILSVALFWFLAANLAGLILCWRRRREKFWRRWLLAQLVVLAASLPWFVAIKFLGQRGTMGGLDWVPPLSPDRLWWAFSGTYFLYVTSLIKVRVFAPGVLGFGGLVAALAVAGIVAIRRQRSLLAVILIAVLCLPVGLLGVSLLISPILMPRYLLWSAAPYFVAAGLGFTLLPKRLQWPALALFAFLLALNLAPYYTDETKPRWDLAGEELQAALQPGDLLLVDDPQAVGMMNLYLNREGQNLPASLWTTDISRAIAWANAGHGVWAVQGPVGQVDHEDQAQFLARISALGTPQFTEQAGLDILLMHFSGEAPICGAPDSTQPSGAAKC